MTLLVRSVVEVNLKEIQQIYSRDFLSLCECPANEITSDIWDRLFLLQ